MIRAYWARLWFFAIALICYSAGAQAANLSAPSSLVATAVSATEIDLSWIDTNSSEHRYAIERSPDPTTGFAHVATVGRDSVWYPDLSLAADTTYYYRIRAVAPSGDYSPYSNIASARTFLNIAGDTIAPSAPTGLTATAVSCNQINISWNASSDTGGSGLAGYKVYRVITQIATTALTSYSNTGLRASTTYSFSVAAYDNAGNISAMNSPVSMDTPACPDTTAPSVPTGLTATAASCSQVNLSWTASTDTGGSGLAGYKIFRGGVQVATTALTSYSNTGLSASTSYSYTVAAYDNAGNTSAQSTAASATTPACADTTKPSVPTGLTATAASCSQVNLSWTASTDTGGSGLAGYKVFRGGVQVATTTSTSYSNTGLAASTSYSFTVAAYDNAGNTSAQTTAVSATTPACADTTKPSVPTGLTATAASCSQVNLSWTASTDTGGSGLAGYKIFRAGVQIATTALTSYSNTGLSASTSYSYTVAAYDNAGNTSAQSTAASATTPACADTTAPSVPTGLTATAASCSQVNLSWTASTDTGGSGLAGYKIFRGGVQIATTTSTSYSNTGLAASTSYSFTVAAYDNAGNTSAQSTAASATTPACADTTAPSVPTGLTATAASCSQVNLSWTASTDTGGSGLAGYKVFRGGVQIATTTLTSYSNTGLAASTSYSFTVAAYDNAGNTSAQSTAASATTSACPDTTAPSVPTGLSATAASCSQVNLSWTASTDTGGSGLAGYKVFRGGVQIATTTSTSYSNSGLAASTSYSFTVAAYDNAGNTSAQSTAASATTSACPDTTAPSVPTGLSATAASCSQVNLSWTASTDTGGSGLAGYKIFRGGVQIATTTLTSYPNTGLAASTSYSYTVAAYDNAGNTSAQSSAASATTPACPDTIAPTVPTGLTATAASCTQVNLSWTASTDTGGSGLAGYKVFRGGVQIATTSSTSYSNTGLSGSTAYSFTVAVYDNAGNTSAQSTAASATTPACPDTTAPSVPTGLSATAASCSQVNLSWTASTDSGGSGLAGYKVYRNSVQVATTTLTSFANTGLLGSTSYSYTVAAYDTAGNTSAQSTAASVTTPACADTIAPSVPTGLIATAVSCTQVNLVWTASIDTGGSGLVGYKVYRNGVQIATTALTSYSNTGLASSTSYSFTIAAYDGNGNTSAQSIATVAATLACNSTWSMNFGSISGDLGSSVAVDRLGNVLVTGYFQNTINLGGSLLTSAGSGDGFVAKYAPDGKHLWSRRFGGSLMDLGTHIAVDPDGNVLVVGYFSGTADFGGVTPLTSAGRYDVFIVKYSGVDGSHLWSKRFGSTGDDYGYGVAVDAAGNVVITGSFRGTVDFGGGAFNSQLYGATDAFLAKYSSSGSHLWSKNFPSTSLDIGQAVAVDTNGNIYLTGFFMGAIDLGGGNLNDVSTKEDVFVAKFSPAGAHTWSRRLGDTYSDIPNALAVDSAGNVVLTGLFDTQTDLGGGPLLATAFTDMFVSKYSGLDGRLVWAKTFGGSGTEQGNGVVVDASDNVIVTGNFENTVDFGSGGLTSAGNFDIFVVKYSGSNGSGIWSKRYGGASSDTGTAVAVDSASNIVPVGIFSGIVDFGSGAVTSAGAADIFILKFSQ